MKKVYISPKADAYNVQVTNILAGSLENGGNGDGRPAQSKRTLNSITREGGFDEFYYDEEDY